MFEKMSVLGLCLGLCLAGHSASFAEPAERWATDKLIIRFDTAGLRRGQSLRPQETLPDVRVGGQPLKMVRRFDGNGMVVRLPRKVEPDRARQIAKQLALQPGIAAAQPDKRLYPAFVPDDPAYPPGPEALGGPGQWYLFEDAAGIRLQDAWDRERGSTSVVIAHLDTGIVAHRDLDPLGTRILPGYDFITEELTANDGDGRDPDPTDPGDWVKADDLCFDPDRPELNQSSWHGLSVAGVMVAEADNGIDIAGIDFAARLLPLRVLGKCGGSLSDVADAIRWAVGLPVAGVSRVNPWPAKVINLSLSGVGACSPEEQAAIDAATASGAVVVVAAGNQASDVAGFSPANCSNVITVGATDRIGGRASYTNVGEEVDISAPGGEGEDGILTLYNTGTTSPEADRLAYIRGTSFPTAQVSAVVALMRAVNGTLEPATIEQFLRGTARPFTDSSCNPAQCGQGILDASAAVSGAADP
ncbi:MAG: S8 family peptidase, partial [Gammaproteobacteria bacterium]